jgi:hypothetical protein
LCEHHLRLSRSYKESSGSGVGSKVKKQKETRNLNSEYYYYSTVIPSEGKRHRGGNANDGTNAKNVEEKMEIINMSDGDEEDEVEVLDHKAMSGSNGEEKLKIATKKARKLAKYRSLDSLPVSMPKRSPTVDIE